MTPASGEIWLADRGEETRRAVFVVSDARFHRLAERAVVAPVLDNAPVPLRPWHIVLDDDRTIFVNLLGTMPTERLLRRTDAIGGDPLLRARRAARAILG